MTLAADARDLPGSAPSESALPGDGVLCFGGEDWWYHNRGHFDMQIMRELAKSAQTLYVNSIGMRFPRVGEGAMFLRRLRRKLASLRRGLVTVEPRFSVYSPLAIPGRLGEPISRALLAWQIRLVLRRLGFARPLIWVNNPAAQPVIAGLSSVAAVVYQRTDRYEEFPGVDRQRIAACDAALKRDSVLTVFCSTALYQEERGQCRRAAFVDHGVDFEAFAAGAGSEEPDDLRSIAHPRVGFVGGIDAHTFDPDLFGEVVARLPDHQFVLVGGCTLPDGRVDAPNVHLLGRKPYDQVWRYPGHCDALIMPWSRSPWIEACNPVKLKEYLAAGKPVVSTWFPELRRYEDLVAVARDARSFAEAIREACARPDLERVARGRERVRSETWGRQGERVAELIREALEGSPDPAPRGP